jgi:serine/threonine-protein kinase RsbW
MLNSIDQLAEGGRGLKLMWQIADELSYTRTLDGRNCLWLSKSYEVEGRDRSQNIKKASRFRWVNEVLKHLGLAE